MEAALRNRLTFGSIMLASLIGMLVLDAWVEHWTRTLNNGHGVKGVGLTLVLMFINPIAIRELAVLFTAERVQPYRFITVFGSALLTLHAFFTQFERFQNVAASTFAMIITGVMVAAAARRATMRTSDEAIIRMAGTVLATLYLGGLTWFLVALRVKHTATAGFVFEGTTWHIVLILLSVKFTDIGAYFTGRAIGRHKLIPWLSPGKTWEGLAGGLITAAAVGAILAPQIADLTWWKGAIFGLVIGGIGQLGDLLESMLKRDAEVKDSGKLVPGFGGVLDIIDSVVLASPFAYILFSIF